MPLKLPRSPLPFNPSTPAMPILDPPPTEALEDLALETPSGSVTTAAPLRFLEDDPETKTLPFPVQLLFKPMTYGALLFHGLLLFLPFSMMQSHTVKPPEKKESPIKVTQVPTGKPVKVKAKSPDKAKISKPAAPKINRTSTVPPLPPKSDSPKPDTPKDTPKPEAQKTDTTAKVDTPPPPPTNQSTTTTTNEATTTDPFGDFPHYQPSTPDCFGKGLGNNCRVANSAIAPVAAFYTSTPTQKGFTVKPADESADSKTFEVTKDNKTYYLSLFDDAGTTVVVLAPERIASLSDLKGAIAPPSEFVELLGSVLPEGDRESDPGSTADPSQFEQPQMFYDMVSEADLQQGTTPDLRAGIDGTPKIGKGQPPAAFYSTYLEADLKGIFQEVKKAGTYGGGDLYSLKKGSTTIYLNLVPMKGEPGTIVITWLTNPS